MKLNKIKMIRDFKVMYKYILIGLTLAVSIMSFVRYLRGDTEITLASLALGGGILIIGCALLTVVVFVFAINEYKES